MCCILKLGLRLYEQEHAVAMKASVKVREGQRPLVRAKVPVSFFCGVPLFSGITVGNERELALHVGSDLDTGPSCRLSYRPNDSHTPLAVLFKTGFGLWGSPYGSPFTIAAEFNIAPRREQNVSFRLRLKPRLGNFSFRKHFCSGTATNSTSRPSPTLNSHAATVEEDMAPSERIHMESNGATGAADDDFRYDCGLSPLGLGHGSGLKVREKECYISGEANGNGLLPHPEMEMETQGVVEVGSPSASMEALKHHPSENGDQALHVTEPSHMNAIVVSNSDAENHRRRCLQSAGSDPRSWSLSVNSVIPFGKHAAGRVQWGMRLPSNPFDDGGGTFYGFKLPVLVLDKISIGSIDTRKKIHSSNFLLEREPLNFASSFDDSMEGGAQVGLLASMCYSMRSQIHNLHTESRLMKKNLEDLKNEILGNRAPPAKPQNRPTTPDENLIRSQLFDELQKKTNGSRNGQKDRNGDTKGAHGEQDQDTLFLNLPGDSLSMEKFTGEPGAKARGLIERTVK